MTERVAFLFDMDGTIADTMPFHLQAWMGLLPELGVRMAPEEFLRKTSGKMNHQILREVLGIPVSDEDLEAFDARKESLFRTLCRPALRPIGGLMEFLSDARRQGIRMALATAAGKANREFTLDGLGVTAYFDAVVGAEDVRSGKPDPEIFLRAAERVGAAPSSCVVFEDALSGVEAAARAGMKAVAMTTSLTAGEFAGHPAVIRIADDYTSLRPQAILRVARGPQPA